MGIKVVDFQSVAPKGTRVEAFQESTIRPDAGAGLISMARGFEDAAAFLGKIADGFTAAAKLQKETSKEKGAAAGRYSNALTNYNLAKSVDTKGFTAEQMEIHNYRLAELKSKADAAKKAMDDATIRDNRAGLFGVISENSWLSTRWSSDVYRKNKEGQK